MASPPRPTPLASRLVPLAIYLALFLLALLPRALGLADFFTTDEAYHWVERVAAWSYAIERGRWAETVLTGHPGVTIMWLGTIGQWLESFARANGWIAPPTPIQHLAWLRLPHALLEALLVPLAYALLRRLVTPTAALVAALLWATSPYLVAHSRLLHLDALLTSFVSLSLLALLAATKDERRKTKAAAYHDAFIPHPSPFALRLSSFALRPSSFALRLSSFVFRPSSFVLRLSSFALSALFAALALLTKGPALILLPVVGLCFLFGETAPSFARRLARATGAFVAWMALVAATVVLCWPALWVAPAAALTRYIEEITANGGRPNGDGQFFLGQAVADPGPLFYLVANLFRATPELLVGLLLFLGWAIATWRHHRRAALAPQQRTETHTALTLVAFVFFWTLVMTLGPKKFDRYVLPTWPALCVLAGVGCAWIADRRLRIADWGRQALLGGLIALTTIPLVVYHPYYLSYYNPLLGGGPVAQRTLLIGWGEGMEQVGAYLSTRPDIGYAPVVAPLGATLAPFLPVPVKNIDTLGRSPANYAVIYLESAQRGAFPEAHAAIRRTVPLERITTHGIDYAEIYQLPRPFERSLDAQFGPVLRLWGVTTERNETALTVTPSWDVRGSLGGDYTLFIHLLDKDGGKAAQIDAPPAGDGPPTSAWQPGQQLAVPFTLPLRAPLPPGSYDLVIGLYDASGARLPLASGPPADPARAGPDALLVETVVVP